MSENTEPDGAMEDEFDVVPVWTQAVVERLGPDYAVPAACRGSASPAALDWLAENCGLKPDQTLVDVGGGMGGPAGFAVREYGVRPLVVEPMPGAVRVARELFGLDAVVASGDDVPRPDGCADVVWCLGVLCTVPEKQPVVAELRRLLRPGGSLGLLVFLADEPEPDGAPEGNHFPDAAQVALLLDEAGFDVLASTGLTDLPAPPSVWSDRIEEVERVLEREHGHDPRYLAAQDQSRRIGHLIHTGVVRGRLLHAIAR
jgi:SAM-dependent methyltransferase